MEDKDKVGLISCACGCGELIPKINKMRRLARFKHGHHSKGENNHWWKGGKYMITKGYYYKLKPDHHFATKDGYVMEHRLVWEEYHKASLLSWADIHHKDGNKINNVPENLDAMIHGKHTTLTNTKDFSNVRCHYCGNSKTYIKNNGKPMWYHKKNDREKFVCKRCYDRLRKVTLSKPVFA